jgi:hypothetical protein
MVNRIPTTGCQIIVITPTGLQYGMGITLGNDHYSVAWIHATRLAAMDTIALIAVEHGLALKPLYERLEAIEEAGLVVMNGLGVVK